MAKQQEKKLINHRMQLPSLDAMLDQMFPEWPEGKHPDFSGPDGHKKLRAGMWRFGERLLFELSLCLDKAAAKGINEALDLVKDPEYTKTVNRRSKRQIESEKESMRAQEAERERYRAGRLTEEEKKRAIGRCVYNEQYHIKQLEEARAERKRIEAITPVWPEDGEIDLTQARTGHIPARDDDEWPDAISFD